MLAHLLCRFLGWLVPDDLFDVDLGDVDDDPLALAWTPDEEIERRVEEFRQLWPDKWEAWLRWCEAEQ